MIGSLKMLLTDTCQNSLSFRMRAYFISLYPFKGVVSLEIFFDWHLSLVFQSLTNFSIWKYLLSSQKKQFLFFPRKRGPSQRANSFWAGFCQGRSHNYIARDTKKIGWKNSGWIILGPKSFNKIYLSFCSLDRLYLGSKV